MISALVIANGEIENYDRLGDKLKDYEFNYVICCDGGVRHLKKLGVKPNFIIGDFDSANKNIVEEYSNQNCEIEVFNVEKDYTDGELGINKAIDLKCEEIIFIGATGCRMDHTLANINLGMLALSNDCNLIVIDEYNIIYTIKDRVRITNKIDSNCSIVPITPVAYGVSTTGLKYPLNKEDVYLGHTRTISNLIIDDVADISIERGIVNVILSEDKVD